MKSWQSSFYAPLCSISNVWVTTCRKWTVDSCSFFVCLDECEATSDPDMPEWAEADSEKAERQLADTDNVHIKGEKHRLCWPLPVSCFRADWETFQKQADVCVEDHIYFISFPFFHVCSYVSPFLNYCFQRADLLSSFICHSGVVWGRLDSLMSL